MPSNQRENARREKQQRKERKIKQIIWIVLAILIFALLIMKVCEINLNSIKKHFANENGDFSISSTADASVYPYAIDSSNVKVNTVNGKLNLLTDSSVTVLNPSNAKAVYSFTHGYANPIMSKSGNYFCIIDQGSNRFRLDTTTANIYEENTNQTILCADVSNNGTVVYATRGENSKSTVSVISKDLKNEMEFDVNDGYVVDTAIDKSGKKLAIASVNSKDAKLVTTVTTYLVGNSEPVANFDFADTNVMDLHYSSSNDLYVVATNSVSVISGQKKLHKAFDKTDVNTVCYGYTDNDELVYVYSKFEGANDNVLTYINSNAKVKTRVELPQKAKYVSSSSNVITVLFNEKIVNYSLKSGKEKGSYDCDDSVSTANRMSSKVFVTRQQLVDVIG